MLLCSTNLSPRGSRDKNRKRESSLRARCSNFLFVGRSGDGRGAGNSVTRIQGRIIRAEHASCCTCQVVYSSARNNLPAIGEGALCVPMRHQPSIAKKRPVAYLPRREPRRSEGGTIELAESTPSNERYRVHGVPRFGGVTRKTRTTGTTGTTQRTSHPDSRPRSDGRAGGPRRIDHRE